MEKMDANNMKLGFGRVGKLLGKISPVLWVVITLMVTFSIISDRYYTPNNFINILQQGAVLLIVSLAATMVILSEGLDLSLGGLLTVSGITTVMSLEAGAPVPVAILVGLLTGIVGGSITGALVSFGKMPPFIATLGMQGVYFGLSLVVTDSVAIFTSNRAFTFLGDKIANYIPMAAIFAGLVFFMVWMVLHHTVFGRYVISIGGNEDGARLSGVNTNFWKWFVYVFAGFVTSIGGVVLAARLEVADPIVGVGWEFEAIAATILGGTSFQKGKGNVTGTIIGVALISVVRNGLNVIGTPSLWQPALIGTIIIMAIVFQVWFVSRKENVK